MVTALCLVIGLVGGVAGGLFGIGGGILIVPALVGIFQMPQHKAQGTSLVALLAPVGIFGLMNYYRANNADLVKGAWIALGFLAGAYLGSKLGLNLSEITMRRTFATFLIFVSAYLWLKK